MSLTGDYGTGDLKTLLLQFLSNLIYKSEILSATFFLFYDSYNLLRGTNTNRRMVCTRVYKETHPVEFVGFNKCYIVIIAGFHNPTHRFTSYMCH